MKALVNWQKGAISAKRDTRSVRDLSGPIATAVLVMVGGLGFGCARGAVSSAETPESTPEAGEAKAAGPSLFEEPASELVVSGQGVSLLFPAAAAFGPEQRVGSWSTLRHEGSGSVLYVAHRPARRTVKPDECADQARASLRLLREERIEIAEPQTFRTPEYFGTLELRGGPDGSVEVIVHAAGLSRCLSLVFVDPEGKNIAYLGLVATEFFPSVRALGIAERATKSRP